MSMSTMGAVAGGMDILAIRRVLKERYRQANNMKSCSAEAKDAKTSSLFGPSEHSLSQRLIDDSKTLVPEMIKILEKMDNNDHQKPNSSVDLKAQRGMKKLNESRDYSFLLSETAEVPKVSKPSPPKPIPKANGNGIPKKCQDKVVSSLKPKKSSGDNKSIKVSSAKSESVSCQDKVSSLKPKKSSGDNKCKVSSAKPESVSKDSLPVSASKSLKSRPRENMVTKSRAASAKKSLSPKQAEISDTKLMAPRKESPPLKRKLTKKRRVEEDLVEDEDIDVSSLIRDIMGRRGERRYRDHGDAGDDRAMVSGFNDILKEESRSAMIARKEDAMEALRLEQEAKQERLTKAKKQRLMN